VSVGVEGAWILYYCYCNQIVLQVNLYNDRFIE
jgi:hypothetical protein